MDGLILVACNTYEGKRYALDFWAEAYREFTYQPREVFTREIAAHDIPCAWVRPARDFWDTIWLGYEKIVERAERIGAEFICSIESDVICPPQTLECLLSYWQPDSVVAHGVPWRFGAEGDCWSLGCCLAETQRVRRAVDYPKQAMEHTLFDQPVVSLSGLLAIKHLYDPAEGR
jgi:hypothetical protein